jgi:hypothetical protein
MASARMTRLHLRKAFPSTGNALPCPPGRKLPVSNNNGHLQPSTLSAQSLLARSGVRLHIVPGRTESAGAMLTPGLLPFPTVG